MNLIQRQYRIVKLSKKLEFFISQELNITQVFKHVTLTKVSNYIATCALEKSEDCEDCDDLTQCLIALAYCAEQLPTERNSTQVIALFIIKTASEKYPLLQPMLDKCPKTQSYLNMLS
ncbi:hypothetical protein HWQ46_14785 [Shewanella sp. D64]|uniref:hypothetical protein n=1 Tax=unclassified Shewanella TaxID=196818 RepID=UPI0022BA45E3|nr:MULTISPECIES: hypothetical protein [unclassified Shewanella]MEC4726818.1 hypothetical protein [Shewanella sp. D64]MEC4739070.1 hypothetical protein [Shewanella sp. E94]WBJ95926.1 hypothetical protein HWQ47_01970 [Shewanella sp. MTB7]